MDDQKVREFTGIEPICYWNVAKDWSSSETKVVEAHITPSGRRYIILKFHGTCNDCGVSLKPDLTNCSQCGGENIEQSGHPAYLLRHMKTSADAHELKCDLYPSPSIRDELGMSVLEGNRTRCVIPLKNKDGEVIVNPEHVSFIEYLYNNHPWKMPHLSYGVKEIPLSREPTGAPSEAIQHWRCRKTQRDLE